MALDGYRLNHQFPQRFRIAAIYVLLAVVASTGFSQDSRYVVRMDTRLGFAGTFKPDRWTPLSLTLHNLGPDIRGTLVVELPRGDRFGSNQMSNRYERALDLSSGTIKDFSFILPLETAVYPLQVSIIHEGREVVSQEIALTGNSASGSLVVVLSRRPQLDFLLPVYNTSTRRRLDLVYPLPEHLPAHWFGLDAVDLFVIHNARLSELGTAQIAAIRKWVAAGGRLVISTGAHFGVAEARSLSSLTDLTPAALRVTRAGALGLQELGLPVVRSEADGQVVVSESPLGTQVRWFGLGRGEVILLPFDYAQFVRVAPATSLGLWAALLDISPPVSAVQDGAPVEMRDGSSGLLPVHSNQRVFEDDLLANQLELPFYNFPGKITVLALVGVYVGAAALIVLWVVNRKRRGGAAVALPLLIVLAVAASIGGYLALTVREQPAEALAFSLELVEIGPDDGYAIVKKDVALFSRQRADYLVRFPAGSALVPPGYESQTVTSDAGFNELKLSVDRWGHENSFAVDVEPLDIRARIQQGVGYANVEVHNTSDVDVVGLVVVSDGIPRQVGDLPPGAIVEHVVIGAGVGNWDELDWDEHVPPGDRAGHRARLLQDLARRQRFALEQGGAVEILVVGWTDQLFIPMTIVPAFERQVELTAIVMHVPIEAPKPTGESPP